MFSKQTKKGIEIVKFIIQKIRFSKKRKRGIETVKFILAKICFQNKQKSIEVVKFIIQKIRFSKQKKQKKGLFPIQIDVIFAKNTKKLSQKKIVNKREAG